jgi:nucleoside phosphorylase
VKKADIVPLAVFCGKIDFAIITVRKDEFEAVLERLPPKWMVISKRHYNVAELRSSSGKIFYIAIVRTPGQGQGQAQSAASDLLTELDPSWLVLVGIGGAKPESEFTLGDVIVATSLHDLSVTAAQPHARSEIAIGGGQMHRKVQNALANLPAAKAYLEDWNSEETIGIPMPPVRLEDECFVGDEKTGKKRSVTLSVADSARPSSSDGR